MKKFVAIILLCSTLPIFGSSSRAVPAASLYSDWAQRVEVNGGARPSQRTIWAMEILRLNCISATLTNKIYNHCVFVPDSVIAASTPLFYHKGSNYWTNTFVIGDLSVNGFKSDGSTKVMDMGLNATQGQLIVGESFGLSCIVTEIARSPTQGAQAALVLMGRSDNDDDPQTALAIQAPGDTYLIAGDTGSAANYMQTNSFIRTGYYSGNRDSNDVLNLYVASPLEAHKLLSTKSVGAVAEVTTQTNTIRIFTSSRGPTTSSNVLANWTTNRMSMAAAHQYFTETESRNFWLANLLCRQMLGGGTGDPIHDYDTFIVNNSGADLSIGTSNALRQFWGRLTTNDLIETYATLNCFLPDNFTACRAPLVRQVGHGLYNNVNFAASNLTVDGLFGDGTSKYMRVGATNDIITRFSQNSGGISLMHKTNTTAQWGGTRGVGNTHFTLVPNISGLGILYLWGATTVNANFVYNTNANSFTNGSYSSGNRTGANAIALYGASSTVAHFSVTNGTGAISLNRFANCDFHLWAAQQNETPYSVAGSYMSGPASFFALHSGHTQTQSSNEWRAVEELRNALGGGTPP